MGGQQSDRLHSASNDVAASPNAKSFLSESARPDVKSVPCARQGPFQKNAASKRFTCLIQSYAALKS